MKLFSLASLALAGAIVAAAPRPSLSTSVLPVLNGRSRVVATTNARNASFVWVLNGTVAITKVVPGLKDTLSFTNSFCPETTVVQLTVAVRGNGTTTTRLMPCAKAPVIVVPPAGSLVLDTINLFRTVSGALRPGISHIDTLTLGRTRIDRIDAGGLLFQVHVSDVADYSAPTAVRVGAVIGNNMRCLVRPQEPTAGMAWHIGTDVARIQGVPAARSDTLTVPGPGLLFPAKIARAMAAQLPIDSLAEWSRRTLVGYLKTSGAASYYNGLYWYTECFGPTAGITPEPWVVGRLEVAWKGQTRIAYDTWHFLHPVLIGTRPDRPAVGDTVTATFALPYRAASVPRDWTQTAIVRDTINAITFSWTDSLPPRNRAGTVALQWTP